jgi:hypothetical protein
MDGAAYRLLLTGLDTVQACYYLRRTHGAALDFEALTVAKERLRASRSRDVAIVNLGAIDFGLRPNGSGSGYPLVLDCPDWTMECGEFNSPSFFVTFRSQALWHKGAAALHDQFLTWAESVGLQIIRPESLSRVDFTFDYWLPAVDFDEDSVVSLSAKDRLYRENRKVQTLTFGKGDVVLRIYDKIAEIAEKSDKVWFFDLWGVKDNVWRIEWQVRKDVLRRFGVRTFQDLFDGQGDVLRYLATEHDSLRIHSEDSNRSRWPIHPLWSDLIVRIEAFDCHGIHRDLDPEAVLSQRLAQIGVAVYGYSKRVAAIMGVQTGEEYVGLSQALRRLDDLVKRVYEPLSWDADVRARRAKMAVSGDS